MLLKAARSRGQQGQAGHNPTHSVLPGGAPLTIEWKGGARLGRIGDADFPHGLRRSQGLSRPRTGPAHDDQAGSHF